MTRKTKLFFILIFSLIPLSIPVGFFIRSSYTGYRSFEQMEKTESLSEYSVCLEDVESGSVFDHQAKDFDQMLKMADAVVKVSATNERKLYPAEATKTKVVVEKTFKGNLKEGESIYVYEPACFGYTASEDYSTTGGYQIMKAGEEYFIFLQNLQAVKGYRFSANEKKTFLPCTASYSKFPVREGEMSIVDSQKLDNGEYQYGEVQNLEIITSEKTVLDKYKNLKQKVLTDMLKE